MNLSNFTTNKITGNKSLRLYLIFIGAILMFIVSIFMEFSIYAETINKNIAQNVIRLHVIANSDSRSDQDLKLAVRDFLLNKISKDVGKESNVSECIKYLNKNLCKLQDETEAFLTAKGQNKKVKFLLGEYNFPTKHYKDISLPAGHYASVRVILGNGNGKNWWCVLFPPLCFDKNTNGKLSEDGSRKLKNALSDEEYKIITSSDGKIPFKLKFKVVEIFQNSQIKWVGLMQRLF